MKNQNITNKSNFLKKIFIKFCRILGYEIIDQANYEVPSLKKDLGDTLSIPGKKSITVPLGEVSITRKVKSVKILFRSCTSELIMDQNKKRLFDQKKSEYTLRSLNSLLKSITFAKNTFNKISFEIIITDTNSYSNDIDKMNSMLSKYEIKNKIVIINTKEFENKIIGNYSNAKFANMANLYTSLELVKNNDEDIVYFVEDDYIHTQRAILEMLFTYEKISSMLNTDIFLLPADYPFLYSKSNSTKIFLGHKSHWRLVDESLVTFMTSKKIILQSMGAFMKMATEWKDPWEKPLHDIYKNIPCFSPIPSLSMHCANINSAFGLPPNIDWKKLWEENSNF